MSEAVREKIMQPTLTLGEKNALRGEPLVLRRLPEKVVIDDLAIGQTSCQFMTVDDFRNMSINWLNEDHLRHIVTLNPEMVMLAEKSPAFREALAGADVRVPDGAGIIWARWFIRSNFWSLVPSLLAFPFITVERITGIDALLLLARLCEQQQKSVYLVGGTAAESRLTGKLLRQRYPHLSVFISPAHAFDIDGPSSVVADIAAKKPAVLFVAYGAAKQTAWIEKNKQHFLHVKIAMGVGGAFSMLSEERPRAPRWLQRLNLEWLWRLLLEPSRLPRIWQATVVFPNLIRRQKLQAGV